MLEISCPLNYNLYINEDRNMFQEPSLFLSPPDAESDQGGKIFYLKKEKNDSLLFAESIADEPTGFNSLKWKYCKQNIMYFI